MGKWEFLSILANRKDGEKQEEPGYTEDLEEELGVTVTHFSDHLCPGGCLSAQAACGEARGPQPRRICGKD